RVAPRSRERGGGGGRPPPPPRSRRRGARRGSPPPERGGGGGRPRPRRGGHLADRGARGAARGREPGLSEVRGLCGAVRAAAVRLRTPRARRHGEPRGVHG